jgi:hypothetical protein
MTNADRLLIALVVIGVVLVLTAADAFFASRDREEK